MFHHLPKDLSNIYEVLDVEEPKFAATTSDKPSQRPQALLCEMFVYYLNSRLLWVGVMFDIDDFAIVSTLHVYNYAKQSGLLTGVWPDLEFIIRINQANHLFVEGANSKEPVS